MIYEQLKERKLGSLHEVVMGKGVRIDDVEIIPRDAGHMIGSAQFEVRLPDKTVVYTGDINCVDTLTTTAAQPVECDELVIEATYGAPYYEFPPRERTYAKIVDWALGEVKMGRIPVFHVYASGKAQEIVRLFNLYTKLRVVAHPSIWRVNEVCNSNGLRLESVLLENGPESIGERSIYVTVVRNGTALPAKAASAVATGWAMRFNFGGFKAFPLSNHADFNQLVEFVRGTKAKTVHTISTRAADLARALSSKLDVKASPIPQLHQRKLLEFQSL